MDENEIATAVLDASFHIHKKLGPGLLESIYEAVLAHELEKRGLKVQVQAPISMVWEGVAMMESFRADLIVEGKVLVELKSVERLHPVHKKQVITYLKISGIKLGILVNFGAEVLRNGIERVANKL